jgi:hypothetical protein
MSREFNAAVQPLKLNVKNLTRGIYMVRVTGKENERALKMIKQ